MQLQIDLPIPIAAAYAWLRADAERDRQGIIEKAILVLAGVKSGDGYRCAEAVEHYGAIAPEVLDELADGAATLAAAFRQEAYVVRMAKGEIT